MVRSVKSFIGKFEAPAVQQGYFIVLRAEHRNPREKGQYLPTYLGTFRERREGGQSKIPWPGIRFLLSGFVTGPSARIGILAVFTAILAGNRLYSRRKGGCPRIRGE